VSVSPPLRTAEAMASPVKKSASGAILIAAPFPAACSPDLPASAHCEPLSRARSARKRARAESRHPSLPEGVGQRPGDPLRRHAASRNNALTGGEGENCIVRDVPAFRGHRPLPQCRTTLHGEAHAVTDRAGHEHRFDVLTR
jgi:hypothetical protein